MAIQNHQQFKGQTSDSHPRTDWFSPSIDPTIPGDYECSTTGDGLGHIFRRRWNGTQWISSVTFLPTSVRMHWRGIKPGGAPIDLYNPALRVYLLAPVSLAQLLEPVDPARARAAKALYAETMAIP